MEGFIKCLPDSIRPDSAVTQAWSSFILLLGSMLLGSFVLLLFGLSIPAVQVAGVAVVCALGWKLLADSPKPADVTIDPVHANLLAMGRAFAPLTMPLTIDAGVVSVAVISTIGQQSRGTQIRCITDLLSLCPLMSWL